MRKLLLVRGPQGSGKSTLIRRLGLDDYALSFDRIRRVIAGPVMAPEGRMMVSHDHEEDAVALARRLLDARMQRGETLVMEQAIMLGGDVQGYLDLARRWRYDSLLVDMGGMPLADVLARNAGRPEVERVPESAVRKTVERLANSPVPEAARVLAWTGEASDDSLREWLQVPVLDLSQYREVIHIGDLQGCLSVLAGPGGPLAGGLDPECFHVFVGDLLDRGIENDQVLRWFLQNACGQPNAALVFGNHELHLAHWAFTGEGDGVEFTQHTLPQLIAAGITRADAMRVIEGAHDLLLYTWRGHKVMVTHAGLPTVPERPWTLGAGQCWNGTGAWTDPVDARFDRLAPDGWVQVHGHRNGGGLPVQASARSFNLEDSVERGGNLRIARLGAGGWAGECYRNHVFKPARLREARDIARIKPLPAWMKEPRGGMALPADLLAAMRAHPGVRERTSDAAPHIASLNFTREVFNDGTWDDVAMKARGLFYNRDTGEIVARSYDKFFNIGERPETTFDAIAKTMAFPLQGFRKENGYLGLIGYDASCGDLFYSSKGTPDSPFTAWLREIHLETTTPAQRESLRRWLCDMEGCLAVEVIDPERDPHMIEYPGRRLVLLDVFRRAAQTERLPYERLAAFAQRFGMTAKERDIVFRDAAQLRGWHRHVEGNLNYRLRGGMSEGLVLEDACGRMVKVKFPAYAFWKSMRSGKDRIRRLRKAADKALAQGRAGVNAKAIEETIDHHAHPLAKAFLGWASTLPIETLEQPIIALRKAFMASPGYDPRATRAPWRPYAEAGSRAEAEGVDEAAAPRTRRLVAKP